MEDDPYEDFLNYTQQHFVTKVDDKYFKSAVVRSLTRAARVVSVEGAQYFAKEFRDESHTNISRVIYHTERIQSFLHPSFVEVYYYRLFNENCRWHLIFFMDYHPMSLERYLREHQAELLTFPAKADLIFRIGLALHELHLRKEHHGGLKKSKVLLTDRREVRLNCVVERRRRSVAFEESRSKKRLSKKSTDISCFLCLAYEIVTFC